VTTATVGLTAPQKALPEPIATTAQDGTQFVSGANVPDNAKAAAIVKAATSQLGVTYVFGAEDPGHSFDCSGLTQWACLQAGITIPRTSEAQYAALPAANPVKPGDLVFFVGSSANGDTPPGHVGVYIGDGKFIDAPYTGAVVRIDAIGSGYMGARRPW
jgi:cell wall-associated NlpC family hydrolase